jgi:hypothetical protein
MFFYLIFFTFQRLERSIQNMLIKIVLFLEICNKLLEFCTMVENERLFSANIVS